MTTHSISALSLLLLSVTGSSKTAAKEAVLRIPTQALLDETHVLVLETESG